MNIPIATYRIQFTPDFGFQDAAGIAGYLADLGISHLYASPIFKARQGSRHGYDGVDPNRLNPELGETADFERLAQTIRRHAMGWLQDIVPNHMAFDFDNALLRDVLENGIHSRYYQFFDIDWNHPDDRLHGRLLAPFLGKPAAQCLADGEIKLHYDEGGFTVVYYGLKLPLAIASYADILGPGSESLPETSGDKRPAAGLGDILHDLKNLGMAEDSSERADRVRSIKQRLRQIYRGHDDVRQFMEDRIAGFNDAREAGPGLGRLDRLLSQQIFHLDDWKTAGRKINYRRFFGINELIALCQEKSQVFDHTHSLLGRLIAENIVSGIRIDHIDGLADPTGYLERLRRRFPEVYILVEKILDTAEQLPDIWPIQGTTGYEFAVNLNALFVRQENEARLTAAYRNFSGRQESFETTVAIGKRNILETQMAGDLDNLVRTLETMAAAAPDGRALTGEDLKAALAEILVRFPVYRSYIDKNGPQEADRRTIRSAVALAERHRPDLHAGLLFLQQLLAEKGIRSTGGGDDRRELYLNFVTKFQQLTAPLMAKGFEDTALYVYNRLLSLNDVGGDPLRFGSRPQDFHAFVRDRARHWPHAMNATATHDSKRGEDVRARINVLSEMPSEWTAMIEHWQAVNHDAKVRQNGREMPDRNEEYFLYQTLIGAFPLGCTNLYDFIERMCRYLVKAAREAAVNTSWLAPDETYEAALNSFVKAILSSGAENRFMKAFIPFCKRVAHYGLYNSLSQTVIKITAPGVPDFYQGTELPDLSLVDPDNRRPVDYDQRKSVLSDMKGRADRRRLIEELWADRLDGRLKMYVIAAALETRKKDRGLFLNGGYIPLQPAGSHRRHVVAFARRWEAQWSLTVVPRFLSGLVAEDQQPLGTGVWQDTVVDVPREAPGRWRHVFTGEDLTSDKTLALGDALAAFPVALLVGEA